MERERERYSPLPLVRRSPDQTPAQYYPRNLSRDQSQGHVSERPSDIERTVPLPSDRNPSQGRSQGRVSSRPSNAKRTETLPSDKPFFTSRSHVEPMAQGSKRLFPIHEPPVSPIQIFCDSGGGKTRDLGSSSCHHPMFQYSNCTGKRKAVCVSFTKCIFGDCRERLIHLIYINRLVSII